jgi:hypothetical protein
MTQQSFGQQSGTRGSDNELLKVIREDMDVYDRNDKHIGHVDYVFLGEASGTAAQEGLGPQTADDPSADRPATWTDAIAYAFGADDDVPEVVQNRLRYNGFIKIDGDGLFAPDRYVLPEQIARVANGRVYLRASRDELVKEDWD